MGRQVGPVGGPGFAALRLSPDEKHIALQRSDVARDGRFLVNTLLEQNEHELDDGLEAMTIGLACFTVFSNHSSA